MSRVFQVLGFLVLVLIGGGLLSPWVWWLGQAIERESGSGWVHLLVHHPFHRYVHRCLLLVSIAGIWPLARALGGRNWRDLGLAWEKVDADRVLIGACLGVGSASIVVAIELATGIRMGAADLGWEKILGGLVAAMASGIAVAVIEEVMFRGWLCGGLQKGIGWPRAIAFSSAVYAAVHFFQRPSEPAEMTWSSGLRAAWEMLGGLITISEWVPGLATLLLFGVLLSSSFRRFGTIYFAMGLHGGVVFGMKMRGVLTASGKESRGAWSDWIRLLLVTGVLWICLEWWSRSRRSASARGESESELPSLG